MEQKGKPVLLDRRSLLLTAMAAPMVPMGARSQGIVPLMAPPASGNPKLSGETGPSSEALRTLLVERVDVGRDSVGYIAGTVDASGTKLVTVGQSGADDGRKLDGDAVFEIGSITKVFTALLLADAAQRGEVALTDPVAKYLPAEGRPLEFDGQPITLLDLVTDTSGLPSMPGNFRPKDPANPFADYTVAQLYAALSTVPPRYFPGAQFEYANLGFGLLVLGNRLNRARGDSGAA